MTAPIARIIIRYLSGIMLARGLLGADDAAYLVGDPDVAAMLEAGIGAALGAGTELWYWAAKRYGWAK